MTPQESRNLKVGDRVYWQTEAQDQGEIVGRDWSGVQIKWDHGKTTYYHHNDMRRMTLLPTVSVVAGARGFECRLVRPQG